MPMCVSLLMCGSAGGGQIGRMTEMWVESYSTSAEDNVGGLCDCVQATGLFKWLASASMKL